VFVNHQNAGYESKVSHCGAEFECGHHVVLRLSGGAAFTLLLVYVSNRLIDKSIYASPIWQLHHKLT